MDSYGATTNVIVGPSSINLQSEGADMSGAVAADAIIAAAKARLPNGAGQLYAPPGTLRLASLDGLSVDSLGQELHGAGRYATRILIDADAVYGLCARAAFTKISNLQVQAAKGRTVTYGVGVTHPTSAEQVDFESVILPKGDGTIVNDFAVGPDVLCDISEVHFTKCGGFAGTNANWVMGMGAGNVVNVAMDQCTASGWGQTCKYGVYSNGVNYTWAGGTVQNHTSRDFYYTTPGSGPVSIRGVRSEGSNALWYAPATSNAGMVHLSDIDFHGERMTAPDWINHEMEGTLILDNVTCHHPAVTPLPYAGSYGPLVVLTRGFGQPAPVAQSWKTNGHATVVQSGYVQMHPTTDQVIAVTVG